MLTHKSQGLLLQKPTTPMKFLATLSLAISVAHGLSLKPFDYGLDTLAERIIKTGPDHYELVSEATKMQYKRQGKKFIDVTSVVSVEDAVNAGYVASGGNHDVVSIFGKQLSTLKKPIPTYNYPANATQQKVVDPLVEQINLDGVKSNLAQFSSFYTRYYKSTTGLDSANWLYGTVEQLVSVLPLELVSLHKVNHSGWDQYSIIVSLKGKSDDKVVVGAHQDSINLLFPNLLRAPGADDDGSGTVTTLEALRLIVSAIAEGNFTPHNTLEFHYYSAEEGGLLGSIDVFSRYFNDKATVVGMLQQDMTGYTKGSIDEGVEPHFGLISDYTSVGLNDFIKLIVGEYCSIPFHETECGYACSDHASALENGYPASFLIESEFKYTAKQIHLTMDTLDRLDFDHIYEHIKLTIGYAVELSAATKL